jgi:hypothetical protein
MGRVAVHTPFFLFPGIVGMKRKRYHYLKDKSNSPARDFALAAKSVRMCKGSEESGLFAEGRLE